MEKIINDIENLKLKKTEFSVFNIRSIVIKEYKMKFNCGVFSFVSPFDTTVNGRDIVQIINKKKLIKALKEGRFEIAEHLKTLYYLIHHNEDTILLGAVHKKTGRQHRFLYICEDGALKENGLYYDIMYGDKLKELFKI